MVTVDFLNIFFLLCSIEKITACRIGMRSGWANDDRSYIFGWT